MICGPTAGGKSDLSDLAGDLLTERCSSYSPVILVDSMQVYKEIPVITNQERRRPAELAGIVSVTEKWTMARHRLSCDEITDGLEVPFVLDAGTGMYLNAILFDIPIAPQVSEDTRRLAEAMSAGAPNPRRASREAELQLSGTKKGCSIWEGRLRYGIELLYVRPEKDTLDSSIAARSSKICREGLAEAEKLVECFTDEEISPSVRDSIGVRELIACVKDDLSQEDAEEQIRVRTRQLARRQMKWFDKLARVLQGRVNINVADNSKAAISSVESYVDKQ